MVLKKKEKAPTDLLSTLKDQIQDWPAEKALRPLDRSIFIDQLLAGDSLFDLEKRPIDEALQTTQNIWKSFQVRRFEDIHIDIKEDSYNQPDRVDITIIQRQIPFITDSILNLLRQNHMTIGVMINATVKIRRDDEGHVLSVHIDEDFGPDLQTDKILHIECEHRGEALDIKQLRQSVSDILRDVHAAVHDWRAMQGQISDTIDELQTHPKAITGEDAYEAAHFLDFLKDGNFTFLGYREHNLRREKGITYFDDVKEKSLGILRDNSFLVFDSLISDEKIPEDVR
jgi:glutamate dehydrogenase